MPQCEQIIKLTETERRTVSDMVAAYTSAKDNVGVVGGRTFAERKIAMNNLYTYIEYLMQEVYTMKK